MLLTQKCKIQMMVLLVLEIEFVPLHVSALRVPVDYNDPKISSRSFSNSISTYEVANETLEEYIKRNNYSSPEECARMCTNSKKRCYYRFYLEHYATFTSACNSCVPTRTNKCQCVLADGVERSIITANRMVPGPSIEVCEGDEVIVDVENNVEGSGVTIHWHGVYQVGTPYYDGVPFVTQCPILQGNKFRYAWKAGNSGTHFWHSHTGFQKMDGLAGSIIIRQPQEIDPHGEMYDFDLNEHVIFVQDWMHELTGQRFPGRRYGTVGQRPDNFLINGKGIFNGPTVPANNVTLERFKVTFGKRYRFRFINAFASVCPIQIVVEKHTLTVIATDGEPVQPVEVQSIISASAERYDFIINANNRQRQYWIQIRGCEECAEMKLQQLAILEYSSGSLTKTPSPTFDKGLPLGKVLNPLDSNCSLPRSDAICVSQLKYGKVVDPSILNERPDERIFLPFRFYSYDDAELFNSNKYNKFFVALGAANLASLVDNISYTSPQSPLLSQFSELDPTQFCNGDLPISNCGGICRCTHLIKVPLNSVVELVLVDEVQAAGIHHPFHLHGSAFYVLGNGVMRNPNESISLRKAVEMDMNNLLERKYDSPPAKDTITIPSNGYVVLRFKADNPGFWLLHCHFLMHLVTGMSAVLQVGTLNDLPPIPKNFPRCGDFMI